MCFFIFLSFCFTLPLKFRCQFSKNQPGMWFSPDMIMKHIGCSGYYYPQWKDKLYPRGLAPKHWLSYYANFFDTVELNGSFYRLPTLQALKTHVENTPAHFSFSVKASRYITHIQRLKEQAPIHDFEALMEEGLGGRLAHILFQMPPSFHFSEENLEKVIAHIPNNPRNVIEFRHISWWNDQVRTALTQAKITFCNVDYPGLDTYFIHTTPNFYMRLHGNPELFRSPYSEAQLAAFYEQFPPDAQRYAVYFNNTITEAGYENALALIHLAGESELAGA
jgi:uncharacterized protein YecE (DUF72 family)